MLGTRKGKVSLLEITLDPSNKQSSRHNHNENKNLKSHRINNNKTDSQSKNSPAVVYNRLYNNSKKKRDNLELQAFERKDEEILEVQSKPKINK